MIINSVQFICIINKILNTLKFFFCCVAFNTFTPPTPHQTYIFSSVPPNSLKISRQMKVFWVVYKTFCEYIFITFLLFIFYFEHIKTYLCLHVWNLQYHTCFLLSKETLIFTKNMHKKQFQNPNAEVISISEVRLKKNNTLQFIQGIAFDFWINL